MIFKTKYFTNETITPKTGLQFHNLPSEVYGTSLQILLTYFHNPQFYPPFTIKTGKKSLFSCIFMFKVDTWVYIPPGISVNIGGLGTLKPEIKTPDLTE